LVEGVVACGEDVDSGLLDGGRNAMRDAQVSDGSVSDDAAIGDATVDAASPLTDGGD
jgi:hypothetical protein